MVNRSLNLLNSRNVITAHDHRKINQTPAQNFSAIVAEQGDGQQVSFAGFFQGHNDVARASAGGYPDCYILWPSLGNQLPQEYDFGSDIIGDGRNVGRLQGERDRRNGMIAGRRKYAVQGPVIGIGRRSAVAENDQLAAAPQTFVNGERRIADLLRLLFRDLSAKPGVIVHFHHV